MPANGGVIGVVAPLQSGVATPRRPVEPTQSASVRHEWPQSEPQAAPESVLQGSGVPEHVPVTPGGAPGLLPPRSFSFSPGQLLQAASASAVSAAPNFDALCFGRMQEMKRWTDRSARGCDRPAEG